MTAAVSKSVYFVDYDVFISYAGEDRETAARPLADALELVGLRVWFDQRSLKVADSLFEKINEGLSRCRYGVVILTENFLSKEWPRRELSALMTRDTRGRPVVLPVLHQLTTERLRERYPMLADRLSVSTERGIDYAVSELLRAMNLPFSGNDMTGLWIGESGRLRIIPRGESFIGDYDWNGHEWAGHFRATRYEDVLYFKWQWDLGEEHGVGYLVLESSIQNVAPPHSARHHYTLADAWQHTLRRLSGGWIPNSDNRYPINEEAWMCGGHYPVDKLTRGSFVPWCFTSVTGVSK